MDVFEIRNRLISDYADYIRGFIEIKDERIRAYVQSCLNAGLLWPDPLIQLNPSFELGDSIDELVDTGIIHKECSKIFRKDKEPGSNNSGKTLRLHKHQSDA